MAVETMTPPAGQVTIEVRGQRRFRSFLSWPSWLLRVLVESAFIMFSILIALALENWREDNQHQRLALQSLRVFEREINQNLARLDDVAPYHAGLRSVVAGALANPSQSADMQSIVEGLRSPVLLNTAWQTSLATGAIAYIGVEAVAALSVMSSHQERFREDIRATLPSPAVTATAATPLELERNVRQILAHLNELVAGEAFMRGVYKEALGVVQIRLRELSQTAPSDSLP
jgi:hypothetical protein